MKILNIATYKFTSLFELDELRDKLFKQCESLALKGTILLSVEGININLSGLETDIREFQAFLNAIENFADLTYRESYSEKISFKRLKVKIKKEIITMNQPHIHPEKVRAASILPNTLKEWLDEKKEILLLDVRNDFEIDHGTFQGAVNLHLENFSQFPEAIKSLNTDKPIVMFCTGGIRCEKAALAMMDQGFSEVYQLEGGILDYFAKVGNAHYQGGCFVFDERVTVKAV